ncbi:hypothetical protein RND81_01G083900 [Saponaria officinalis]|uniref:CCHC-type domain-containing protein n=1 Tax=Saponaria officinalis TaxID=3572 RepID=A0AAW1NH99_SAPOF
MDFNNADFLNAFRDALHNLGEYDPRWRPRRGEHDPPRQVDEFKVTELPEFVGGTDPEAYLEWERKIDRMFDFKDLDDEKRCKYAIFKLSRGASLWFEGVKSQRARAGKAKITSWETLKRKFRKRYIPTTHRLTLYRKIADLVQGKLSVNEYIEEFENLALMGEIEESEEQKMSRFLRGLNRNIANFVELYPYANFDTLCGLCLKHETQSKARSSSWFKAESSSKSLVPSVSTFTTPKTVSVPTPAPNPKPTAAPREVSLAKVRCFKCQGFGHYQNACPNKPKSVPSNFEQRDQIFHTKCQVGDKWCSVIVDGGSCTNVASSEMVTKLGLTTTAHPRPYALHWLDDGSKVRVSRQVRVGLTMGSYSDEIVCDVIPMDACHVLLGRPWQFDRDVVHRGRRNEYELRDKGRRIVLKPMSPQAIRAMRTSRWKKPNLSVFASEREIERLEVRDQVGDIRDE